MGFISNPSPIMGNDPNDLPRQIEVDEAGVLKTSITGSLANQVQEYPIIPSTAITDTANHDSAIVDISLIGGRKTIFVTNTLNQSTTLTFISYKKDQTGASISPQTVVISGGGSKCIMASDIKELGEPIQAVKLRLACAAAPTSGSVQALIEGVVI